jgi:hypothetical protein
MNCLCKTNKSTENEEVSATGTREVKYDLTVGDNYKIYSQCVFNKHLMYLLDPADNSKPNWYPAHLFEITDGRIPSNWQFRYYEGSEGDVSAIWGYPELIQIDEHFNDLSEREPAALLIFANRKLGEIAHAVDEE